MMLESGKEREELFDRDLPLPSSLSWEEMEAGILAKMEAKRPFYRRPFFRWFGLGILLVSAMLIWLTLSTEQVNDKPLLADQQTENLEESSLVPSESAGDAIVPAATTTATLSPEIRPSIPIFAIDGLRSGTNEVARPESRADQPPKRSKSLPLTIIPATPALAGSRDSLAQKTTGEIMPVVSQSSIANPSIAPLKTTLVKEETNSSVAKTVNQISAQLPGLPTEALAIDINLPLSASEKLAISKRFRSSQRPWRILLQAGTNAFNSGYAGANQEIVDLRKASEYFDPGTQVELRIERKITANWFAGSGLGQHTYRSRLDVEATKTFRRLYNDVLIRYNQDPISGEINNQVYADTMLRVTQFRKIKHYNSYRSWEIPVYLGYQQQKGRWNFAGMLGLIANINRQMDGRVFDADGEVGTLGSERFLRYSTTLGTAYTLEGRLGYRLFSGFDIHASLARQSFLSNWMTNSNNALSSSPTIWRVNVGGSVRF